MSVSLIFIDIVSRKAYARSMQGEGICRLLVPVQAIARARAHRAIDCNGISG
jgi:hypothetical protein